MKNKIIFIPLILLITLVLGGCMNEDNVSELDEAENYSLVSTEDRLVFKKENNYEVYYLNNNIIKIEKVKAFANSDYASTYYGKQNALDYKSIKCIDNLVIFEMNDEYLKEYNGLLRTDVMFSMIQSGFEYVEES